MKQPNFDEAKLSEAMEIIEAAASLMEEHDCENEEKAGQELAALQERLRAVTGNKELDITCFQSYWSYTSLKTVAKKALIFPPPKESLTDAEIKELVLKILDYEEAEMDYWLEYLKLNAGLSDLTDYIFYPDMVGLDEDATLEEIADKILADRKVR